VDDALTARTLQRNALKAAGYEVTTAVDGGAAWKLLRENTFELLVADVQMPVLDGFELTRKVRSDSRLKNLPIILVTGLGQADDIARGADAGADEYLVKGEFQQDELLKVVARLL